MFNLEMRQVYSQTLLELAQKDERVVCLEADLSSSISTNKIKEELGKRYINVGIMEAEEMGVAAGLSVTGYIPFIHTFAPFATRRAFDQVFISLGFAQNHAIIVGSDAGVTAEMNGGTHMPFEDLALMRAIPNISVYEVSDPHQFKYILEHCYKTKGLHYIRTVRKVTPPIYEGNEVFGEGLLTVVEGTDVTIAASGIMVSEARCAAEILLKKGISAKVVDVFRIKPINQSKIVEIAQMGPIVTAENHNVIGGLGSAVAEVVVEQHPVKMSRIGVKEQFGQVGTMAYLMEEYELTKEAIVAAVEQVLNK